jgi:hypothetical protein
LAGCAKASVFVVSTFLRLFALSRHSGRSQQRELVKPESGFSVDVIPAQAGIHFDVLLLKSWIPAFAGMTIKKGSAKGTPCAQGGRPRRYATRLSNTSSTN